MLQLLLRRQGCAVNHKKLNRIFREEKLVVRKRALGLCAPMTLPSAVNERWSLDFVSDAFADGHRFRVLCVADDFTRECLKLVGHVTVGYSRGARTERDHRRARQATFDCQRQWQRTDLDGYAALTGDGRRLALHPARQAARISFSQSSGPPFPYSHTRIFRVIDAAQKCLAPSGV